MPVRAANAAAGWGLFAIIMVLLAIAIGVVESVIARLQMRHVPRLLVAACLLSGFGVILLSR
jgi:formate hydrogenlyase subunit 4